jgi:hypothetical protein
MTGTWYCTDCGDRIAPDAVESHDRSGHQVVGRIRPDRLLSEAPMEGDPGGES